jgi:hypothetical protein
MWQTIKEKLWPKRYRRFVVEYTEDGSPHEMSFLSHKPMTVAECQKFIVEHTDLKNVKVSLRPPSNIEYERVMKEAESLTSSFGLKGGD